MQSGPGELLVALASSKWLVGGAESEAESEARHHPPSGLWWDWWGQSSARHADSVRQCPLKINGGMITPAVLLLIEGDCEWSKRSFESGGTA